MKKPKIIPWYNKIIKKNMPKENLVKKFLLAFIVGGGFCALAEFFHKILLYKGFSQNLSTEIVIVAAIAIAVFFTGLGLYDKLAQNVGAALSVPITGFANSVASATIEHKSEGMVLGSGSKSFMLAGAVIMFGLAAAFIVTLIKYLFLLVYLVI
ncbi:MAG: SpoVA/SpoVAEb family sporulation membrane protein [Bacillota bacterium]|jgi:stage V sporulation protein AC